MGAQVGRFPVPEALMKQLEDIRSKERKMFEAFVANKYNDLQLTIKFMSTEWDSEKWNPKQYDEMLRLIMPTPTFPTHLRNPLDRGLYGRALVSFSDNRIQAFDRADGVLKSRGILYWLYSPQFIRGEAATRTFRRFIKVTSKTRDNRGHANLLVITGTEKLYFEPGDPLKSIRKIETEITVSVCEPHALNKESAAHSALVQSLLYTQIKGEIDAYNNNYRKLQLDQTCQLKDDKVHVYYTSIQLDERFGGTCVASCLLLYFYILKNFPHSIEHAVSDLQQDFKSTDQLNIYLTFLYFVSKMLDLSVSRSAVLTVPADPLLCDAPPCVLPCEEYKGECFLPPRSMRRYKKETGAVTFVDRVVAAAEDDTSRKRRRYSSDVPRSPSALSDADSQKTLVLDTETSDADSEETWAVHKNQDGDTDTDMDI